MSEAGKSVGRFIALFAIAGAIVISGIGLSRLRASTANGSSTGAPAEVTPHVAARSPEEAGRYLVLAGGCNDCHTPGWMQDPEKVPESEWLTGVPIGWRGPWGTTYASNLRLFIEPFDEQQWVHVVRTRNSRPPMPWVNLHSMSDQDLRSIYRYLKSLPRTGSVMPDFVPPDREPKTPYVSLFPQNLPTAGQPTASAEPSSDR